MLTEQLLLSGTAVSAGSGPTVVLTDYYSTAVNGTTFNPTVDIGTADANRSVVVCWGPSFQNSAGASTSVEIDSTVVTPLLEDSFTFCGYSWSIKTVATGTTCPIKFVSNQAIFSITAYVFAVYDLASETLEDSDKDDSTATGSLTASVTVPAGGVALAMSCGKDTTVITHSWSTLTEQQEDNLEDAALDNITSCATGEGLSGSTSTTVTYSGTMDNAVLSMIALR